MGKTGRPRDIDSWRERQYLDLERRRPDISPGSITAAMLDSGAFLEDGYYAGDRLGFTERGHIVVVDNERNSLYGECRYCIGVGYYDGGLYGDCLYGFGVGYYGGGVYDDAEY